MQLETLLAESRPFLEWLLDWHQNLERAPLADLVREPERCALLAVDLVQGFCVQGPLSSERVAATVPPIVDLFQAAEKLGVSHFLLLQDHHPADAVEFGSFGPHCVAGTAEAETIPELAQLPFSDRFQVFEKNSISSSIHTELEPWLEAHPELDTLIVVGDCTDLCTYQLAMFLRLRANARQQPDVRVILPVEGVQTYDLPVAVAQQIGAVPHPGDLLHLIFLYHMHLNGVEIVAGLD